MKASNFNESMFNGNTRLRGNPGPHRRKRRPGGATAWIRRGLLALLLLAAPLSGAEGGARKPVRVAYQEFNRLMVVDAENKPVSGYAFEYLQTIGTYARWDVEYVPCDSFADSVKRLLAGDVDLIYEISYTFSIHCIINSISSIFNYSISYETSSTFRFLSPLSLYVFGIAYKISHPICYLFRISLIDIACSSVSILYIRSINSKQSYVIYWQIGVNFFVIDFIAS